MNRRRTGGDAEGEYSARRQVPMRWDARGFCLAAQAVSGPLPDDFGARIVNEWAPGAKERGTRPTRPFTREKVGRRPRHCGNWPRTAGSYRSRDGSLPTDLGHLQEKCPEKSLRARRPNGRLSTTPRPRPHLPLRDGPFRGGQRYSARGYHSSSAAFSVLLSSCDSVSTIALSVSGGTEDDSAA